MKRTKSTNKSDTSPLPELEVSSSVLLSKGNFHVGLGSRFSEAEWAAKLYYISGFKRPIFLRTLHYFALTRKEHIKPDGSVYRNTVDDYAFLVRSFNSARYLNILPHEIFARSPYCGFYGGVCNSAKLPYRRNWQIGVQDIIESGCIRVARTMVSRFMPIHFEIWVENSSSAGVALPAAEKYNLNLIANEGEIPLAELWRFLRGVCNIDKPILILYLTDLGYGKDTVIPASEKIKALLSQYRLSSRVDIRFKVLMLKRRQCRRFNLPAMPGSPSGSSVFSKDVFNDSCRFELYALEAIRPGYVAANIERYLKRYLTPSVIKDSIETVDLAMKELFSGMAKVAGRCEKLFNIFEALESVFRRTFSDGVNFRDAVYDLDSQVCTEKNSKNYRKHNLD